MAVLLLFRFLIVMLASRFRSRIGALDESVVRFTVFPQDSDLNFHLNAGRFISFMDVARMELLGRMRLFNKVIRKGWRPIMGGCIIRFRRSVMPFERFDIRSRLVGWDEKWFYLEHIVEKEGVFCAAGHMRAVIRGPSGNIPPREVVDLVAKNLESPAIPDFVAQWRDLEDTR